MLQERGDIMQPISPQDPQRQADSTPHLNGASGSQPVPDEAIHPIQPEQTPSVFYTQDEDEFPFQRPLVDEPENLTDHSSPFVLPFQSSGAMPAVVQNPVQGASSAGGMPPSPSVAGAPHK